MKHHHTLAVKSFFVSRFDTTSVYNGITCGKEKPNIAPGQLAYSERRTNYLISTVAVVHVILSFQG